MTNNSVSAAAIGLRGQRVALLREGDHWSLPAAPVPLGQSPQLAALCVLQERVGLPATIDRLGGVYADDHGLLVVYTATFEAGEQQVSSLPHRRADDMRPSAGEQQVSSLPHRRADDMRPSAGEQQVSSLPQRRADDYALGPASGRSRESASTGCRPSAGARWLRPALLGAAALGMCVLSGYPPLLYFAGLWLLALWLFTVITFDSDHSLRAAGRALLPLLVIAIGGAVLGAVLLLPVEQFSLVSTRAQSPSLAFSGSYPLTGSQVLTLLVPNLFGQPRLPGDAYWGVPFYEELTAYVGVLPLLALFLARRRPAAVLMLVFAAFGLIVSLGIDGGLFTFLYRLLPGYSLFRAPSRALYFVVVGAAGSVALLITDLQAASVDERARMLRIAVYRVLPLLALLALLAALALGAYFTLYSTDPAPPWKIYYAASMLGNSAVMLGAAWLVLRAWLARPAASHTRWLVALTIGVLLIDLWRLSAQHVNVSAFDVPELWQAMDRAAPASPEFRVMTVPGDRVVWQAGAAYTHHLNAGGYDPLISDAYQRLLEASRYNPASPVARLLGVRYAIGDAPFEQSHLPGADRLTLLKSDGTWRIYTLSDPLPRAFVAPVVVTEPDDAAVRRQIAASEVDPGRTVFVPQPVACAAPSAATTPTGSAHIVRYEPNAVEVAAESVQGGVLVLSDAYDPNWDVRVDGAPANLLRVDTALRGVCVSAGAHRVTFDYTPRLFFAGLIISVLAWLGLLTILLKFR
jgi:ADP-ribose pyrophosphatase YjhB (NUDIX family)